VDFDLPLVGEQTQQVAEGVGIKLRSQRLVQRFDFDARRLRLGLVKRGDLFDCGLMQSGEPRLGDGEAAILAQWREPGLGICGRGNFR